MSHDCPPSPTPYPSDCEVTEGLRKMAYNKQEQELDEGVLSRAKGIKLLLLDVDGVLTDGILLYSHEGFESKGFNTQDGFGIRLLQEAGIDVGVITARKSSAVTKRAQDLKLRFVYQGNSNKLQAYNEIVQESGLKPFEVGYMGDDWLDLILLKRVGFAATPANGVAEVKEIAHYTCNKKGGKGAVREVCDLILKAKGLQQKFLQIYMNK